MKIPKLVRQAFCVLTLLILLTLFCGVAGAQDPQTVKRLQKLIEQQQKQLKAQQQALEAQSKALQNLQNRVEAMSKGAAAGEQQAAKAEELASEAVKNALAAKAEADRAHRETTAIDLRKEEDRQRTKGTNFGIPDTKTVVTLGGYAQLDVIHDFDKIESPTAFAARRIVVDGKPSGQPNSRTTIDANTSRFVIGSATPTGYGKLSTLVSMDFFGNSTSDSPDPRLRQAWGQLDDFFWGGGLRGGQSWTSWDDLAALPETLDFEGPNASQQNRQGLIRWFRNFQDKYTLWVSVENPGYDIGNGTTKSRLPDTIVSLNWHGDWGHLKPALIGRDLQGKNNRGKSDNAFGWGAQLAGTINVPLLAKKDNISFQSVYGAGIGSYNNDGGIDDGWFNGKDLKAIKTFQGYGALQHWWIDSLRSTATFGYVYADLRNTQSKDTLEKTMYFAGNLIWSPIKQMDLGAEFLWGQRDNKNGDVGTARRIQLSTKYSF